MAESGETSNGVARLLGRVERAVGEKAARWPLRFAERAGALGRWETAFTALSRARDLLDRVDADRALSDEVESRWLRVALTLAATGDREPLDTVLHALGPKGPADRPAALRSVGAMGAMADELVAADADKELELLADSLDWFFPSSPSRSYLRGRLMEAAAAIVLERQPIDGDSVLRRCGIAESEYRQAELAPDGLGVQARLRRAALYLRLSPPGDREAKAAARAALEPLKPFALPPGGQLIYATAQLDGPRRMRRVRAMDLLAKLAGSKYEDAARALLINRLDGLGSEARGLEYDRVLGATEALFGPDLVALVEAHLDALERYGAADSAGDLAGQDRGYLAALRVALGDDEGALPVPDEVVDGASAGRIALAGHWSSGELETLLRFYRRCVRRDDLRPLAVWSVRAVQSLPTMALESATPTRDLLELYIERGPTPRYGFGSLSELLLAAGEVRLAGEAAVRALTDLDDMDLEEWEHVQASGERGAALRLSNVILQACRDYIECGENARATRLLRRGRRGPRST